MFGAVPAPANAPVRGSTQLFGGAPAAAASPVGGSTQLFGGTPAAAGAPVRGSTQLFGGAPAVASAPAARGSTQLPTGADPAPPRTQIFGSPVAGATQAPARAANATILFAGGLAQNAQPNPVGQPVRSRTPQFGMTPSVNSAPSPESRARVALPPDNSAEVQAPHRRSTVESPAASGLVFEPETQPNVEDAVVAQLRRHNRVGLVLVIAVLVGIPAILAVRSFAKRRPAIPSEVVAAEENVLGLLRRDDRRSRAQALKEIDQLVQHHGSMASVRALQVLVLTLELDDVKVGLKRIQNQSEEINRRLARMRDRRSPSDWEAQISRGIARLQVLKQQSDPLVDEASSLDNKVNAAFPQMLAVAKESSGPEELAVTRAEAVYFGVKGSERALQLSERYRLLGGKDGWDVMAFAEYAANAHVAPDTMVQARSGLQALRAADPALLRGYVLAARLALAQRDYDQASSLGEAAAALNPSHELARQLLGWIEESRNAEH